MTNPSPAKLEKPTKNSSENLTDQAQVWMLTSRKQRKRPWSLIFAIGAHALLLLLQLPAVSEIEAEPETKKYVRLVPSPRFKAPEIEPLELRPPKARKEPMPDPTPDAPEPMVQTVEIEPTLDLPSSDELFVFPSGPPPAPRDTGPVLIQGDVKAPVALKKILPQYTEIARRVRREGVVVLKAVIDEEGRIVDAKILKPLGLGLDEAALEAARQWRFTPATLHGKPIAVYMNLTVRFFLS